MGRLESRFELLSSLAAGPFSADFFDLVLIPPFSFVSLTICSFLVVPSGRRCRWVGVDPEVDDVARSDSRSEVVSSLAGPLSADFFVLLLMLEEWSQQEYQTQEKH